ncbi:MAG: RNA polymerase sigma-70 factor [Bacteroidota bacterium]
MALNEEMLVRRIAEGETAAFDALFDRYYRPACIFALRYVRNMDNAEDIVQDVFVKIWEGRAGLNPSGSFSAFLFLSVRNKCIDWLRRSGTEEKVIRLFIDDSSDLSDDNEPAIKIELLRNNIEKLPGQCKRVFKMHRFESMKYADIANRLGISVKTVENHMGKALRFLREEMKKSAGKG